MLEIQPVTALTIGGSLTFGMALALLGHLKLALSRRPEHAIGRIDLLLSLLNLALIPMIFAAGLLVDFWGTRYTIILGSVLMTLAFLALSAGTHYVRSLLAVTVAAFGAAAVGTSSLVLMPRGLFGAHESTASLLLGLVLVALGALLTPPLVDLLTRAAGFRRTMATIALVMLVPAFLAALPARGELAVEAHPDKLPSLLQDHAIWLAGAVFFCYAPLEAFVSVWTTTLLQSVGEPRRQVRWLAGFWIAFLLSRLGMAFLEHTGYMRDDWSAWLLFGFALLSAVVIGNLAGAFRVHQAATGLVILGLFMGPLLPFLAGMVFRLVDAEGAGRMPGTAFGMLYACGSLGSLLLSPLVRLSASARTFQAALRIPLFMAMILAAATLVFVLTEGR
jgi:hypothetical protein